MPAIAATTARRHCCLLDIHFACTAPHALPYLPPRCYGSPQLPRHYLYEPGSRCYATAAAATYLFYAQQFWFGFYPIADSVDTFKRGYAATTAVYVTAPRAGLRLYAFDNAVWLDADAFTCLRLVASRWQRCPSCLVPTTPVTRRCISITRYNMVAEYRITDRQHAFSGPDTYGVARCTFWLRIAFGSANMDADSTAVNS